MDISYYEIIDIALTICFAGIIALMFKLLYNETKEFL